MDREGVRRRPFTPRATRPVIAAAGHRNGAYQKDGAVVTTDLHEFGEFAPQAQFHLLERSGSFGQLEEPDAVFEHLRNFWT